MCRLSSLAVPIAPTLSTPILFDPTILFAPQLLAEYRGVLLVASHDRAFMDAAADRLLVLKGDGVVRLFDAPYSDYLALLESERRAAEAAAAATAAAAAAAAAPAVGSGGKQQQQQQAPQQQKQQQQQPAAAAKAAKPAAAGAAAAAPPPKKRTLGLFERKEMERLDKEIADLGARRDALNERLVALASGGGAALEEIERASLELAEVDRLSSEKEERWLELAEIAGDI